MRHGSKAIFGFSYWLSCHLSACLGSADMPLPFGEALGHGQEAREILLVNWVVCYSGVLWCSMEIGAPCVGLLCD